MDQESLFHEDIYDALKTVIQRLGGAKRVGSDMRPELSADKGGEWLLNCLNRSRHEKLDAEQIIHILREGRKVGCHAAMWFIAESADYEQPAPIEPEDERARLQREYIQSVKALGVITKRLEKLG